MITKPLDECPSLRALTSQECIAIGDILKLRNGRSVTKAVRDGYLHGVDVAPEGSLWVALTDRTRFTIVIEVLAGPPLRREGRREIRHVIYGSPTHPIGADSVPLDTITETYLVNGLRDFIATNDLYFVRDKTVCAMPGPSSAPIARDALKVFKDRCVLVPAYPGRAGAETFKVQCQQLLTIAERVTPIRLCEYTFANGALARTLADVCSIYHERA